MGRFSAQVFQYLDASGSLETLLTYFARHLRAARQPGEPYRLELEPRYARIAKRLASMTLWIDRRALPSDPRALRRAERRRDRVPVRATCRPNAAIPAERFVLELPEGVEVQAVDLGGARDGAGTP